MHQWASSACCQLNPAAWTRCCCTALPALGWGTSCSGDLVLALFFPFLFECLSHARLLAFLCTCDFPSATAGGSLPSSLAVSRAFSYPPQTSDALSLYSCRCGLVFRYSRQFPATLGTSTKLCAGSTALMWEAALLCHVERVNVHDGCQNKP